MRPSREDMTADEAAAELRVRPATVRAYCRAGRLPGAYRVGGEWRIPQPALAFAAVPAVKGNEYARPPGDARAKLRVMGWAS